jgi:hypothetical protein
MADPILFNSACFHGFIVAGILLYAFYTTRLPKYLIALLATVIITSVWNHGVSNDLAKWCDRTAVTITIIALSLYIYQTKQVSNIYILFLLFIVGGLYFTAKNIKRKNKVVCLVPLGYACDRNRPGCLYSYFICIGKNPVIGRSPLASLFI